MATRDTYISKAQLRTILSDFIESIWLLFRFIVSWIGAIKDKPRFVAQFGKGGRHGGESDFVLKRSKTKSTIRWQVELKFGVNAGTRSAIPNNEYEWCIPWIMLSCAAIP
jgi:hypothetical protein